MPSSFPSSLSLSSRARSSSWLQLALLTVLTYIIFFSAACCHAMPMWQSTSQLSADSNINKGNVNAAGKVNNGQSEAEAALTGAGGFPSRAETGELDSPDSILERCLSEDGTENSIFVKTLCSLAMLQGNGDGRTKHHQAVIKRGLPSDKTSFSSFHRLVARLVNHANEISDYQERLNELQAMGMIDSDYNVISIPPEMVSLMQRLG